jgi:hypothetical protein
MGTLPTLTNGLLGPSSEVKVAKPRNAKPTNGAVFSPKITLKNGRVIYAADYGLKAFCFHPRLPKKR